MSSALPPAPAQRRGIAGVVAGRGDRLGGRLRNLLEAWRLARAEAAPLLWLWVDSDDQDGSPYPLDTLFDAAALARVPGLTVAREDRHGRLAGPPPSGWADALARRDDWLDASVSAPPTGAILRHRAVDPIVPDRVAPDIATLFRTLPIHPAVRDAVEAAAAPLGRTYRAVHLRRGDVVAALARCPATAAARTIAIANFVPRYAPAAAYDRAIAAASDDAPLAIFSDDPHLRAAVARRHAGRAIDPHAALDDAPLGPLQRDFAELLLIAGAATVIGAGDSQYCRVAAALGGARFIDVRDHVDPAETIAALRAIVADATLVADTLAAFATLYRARDPAVADVFAAAAAAQPASAR